jgi:hypothetical protein
MMGILDKPTCNYSSNFRDKGKKHFNFREYICFNCGRPGHFAQDCKQPKKKKKGNFSKMFRPKKCFRPKELHSHVQALLNEMDDEEQEEFYIEAEREGFSYDNSYEKEEQDF